MFCIIDDPTALKAFVQQLADELKNPAPVYAVDFEWSEDERIVMMQLHKQGSDIAYLLDIKTLGTYCLRSNAIVELLEGTKPLKLMFDPRHDAIVLRKECGIGLRNVICCKFFLFLHSCKHKLN